MNKKLKEVRASLLKSAKELDKVSKCQQAKMKLVSITVNALLNGYYKR